jgi:cation transport regulator ChaB
MPYKTNADLPPAIKNALPEPAQNIWRGAHNGFMESNPDATESSAAAVAWSAVKRKYKKSGEEWVAKDSDDDPESVLDAKYSAEQRREMAKSGEAMPDGSFPIKTRADVKNAVHDYGRGPQGEDSKVKAHIIKRAKALDATDLLPQDWPGSTAKDSAIISLALTDTYAADEVHLVVDAKPRKVAGGYMVAHAKIARTGIQLYRGDELDRPELAEVKVYRPEDEVFSQDSMRSYAHKPITLDHPARHVDSTTWSKVAKGSMGQEVVRDGDFVSVPLMLLDQEAIDAVEKRNVKELSVGYTMDLTWEPGKTKSGEAYDAVMSNIRVNHLAVVPNARGGPELRVGDDDPNKGKERPMATKTFTIDRVGVTTDETAAQIIEKAINDRDASLKEIQTKLDKAVVDAVAAKTAADAEIAALKTQVSAKDGEIVVLKKSVEDGKVTPDKLSAMVKDRSILIAKAASLLGDKYPYDTKTDAEIMRDAVAKHMGDAEAAVVKAMDDAGIGGAFRAATKDVKIAQTKDGATALAGILDAAGRVNSGGDPRDAAYAEGCQNLSDAWRHAGNPPPAEKRN